MKLKKTVYSKIIVTSLLLLLTGSMGYAQLYRGRAMPGGDGFSGILYLRAGLGYGYGIGNQVISTARDNNNTGNITYKKEKLSFGSGIDLGLAAGYMFTPQIGIDLGLSYHSGHSTEIESYIYSPDSSMFYFSSEARKSSRKRG